jgi:hypothetical protein
MNRQELIRADAEAPVAELLGKLVQVALLAVQSIDKYEIVAATVHLCEVKLDHLWTLKPLNAETLELLL